MSSPTITEAGTRMAALLNYGFLQRALAAMVAAGDAIAVVETTSHGLAQERVGGIALKRRSHVGPTSCAWPTRRVPAGLSQEVVFREVYRI